MVYFCTCTRACNGPLNHNLLDSNYTQLHVYTSECCYDLKNEWLYVSYTKVTCLQFSGNRIVSGSDDNTLRVWNATTGKVCTYIHVFMYSYFVSVLFHACMYMYIQHLRTLVGHTGGVWCSEFNGVTVVSGSTDRTLRVRHWLNIHMHSCLCSEFGCCIHLYHVNRCGMQTLECANTSFRVILQLSGVWPWMEILVSVQIHALCM